MLVEMASMDTVLEQADDAFVARLLDEAAGDIPMTDPLFLLITSAAGRLRRAGLGHYEECSFCNREATKSVIEQKWCGECELPADYLNAQMDTRGDADGSSEGER